MGALAGDGPLRRKKGRVLGVGAITMAGVTPVAGAPDPSLTVRVTVKICPVVTLAGTWPAIFTLRVAGLKMVTDGAMAWLLCTVKVMPWLDQL